MIIACPACSTRYVAPDSAIGVDGRMVRCAKCRHSWHQDGPILDLATAEAASEPSEASPPPIAVPPASPPEPAKKHDDAAVVASREEADRENTAPTVVETESEMHSVDDCDDTGSQFDYAPPFRPRRNPLRIWTAAAAVFALLALGTVAAVSYWGVPDWVPVSRPTFAVEQPNLQLDFPADQQDRRTLPNGTEFFGASGTITNIGRETQPIPSILIVMRDERERIVYSWEVVPPRTSLAPGESLTINEAVTDVPKSAKFAEIGWKPG